MTEGEGILLRASEYEAADNIAAETLSALLKIGLVSAAPDPVPLDAVGADFTEAIFTGYAAATRGLADALSQSADGHTLQSFAAVTFQADAVVVVPDTVIGVIVYDTDINTPMAYVPLDTPIIVNQSSQMIIVVMVWDQTDNKLRVQVNS